MLLCFIFFVTILKKHIKILEHLLEEVLSKKLPWYIINKNMARETCWKHGYDERVMLKNHNINDMFI